MDIDEERCPPVSYTHLPTKATPYRPENIDILARQKAQLAKKDKLKTFRFTDKAWLNGGNFGGNCKKWKAKS